MSTRYSVGWSDYQGVYGAENHYMYRKEMMTMWTHVLPKRFHKYKIVCGTNVIGDNLTEGEADALLAILLSDLKD